MSDTHIPPDYRDRLDLQAELERIDRNRAETQKLYAEAHRRDRWILALTVLLAVLAAIIARLPEILGAFGFTPS